MDPDQLARLQAIAAHERFEAYLENHEGDTYRLIKQSTDDWTSDDILLAAAILATQRAVIAIERVVRRAKRQEYPDGLDTTTSH